MSETTETPVTETPTAPAPAPPSEDTDREDALLDEPAGPSKLDSLARTDSVAGKPMPHAAPKTAPPIAEAPKPGVEPPKVEPPKPAPTDAIDPDTRALLAKNNLRAIPGETREQARDRLMAHYSGRATSHFHELQGLKDSIDRLQAWMTPMARAYYQQLQQQERESIIAQIPDKERDPQGYAIWLAERGVQMQVDRETREAQAQQQHAAATAEQQQAEAVAEAIVAVDEEAIGILDKAIAEDAPTADAYATLTDAAIESARVSFPGATEEELHEFVELAQHLELRMMHANGVDIPAAIRDRAASMRRAFGAPAPETPAPSAPAPVASAPANSIPQLVTSPTAERVAAQSAAQAARAVVTSAPPPTSAPTGLSGRPDIRNMDEDEFVDAFLDGRINEQDVLQTYGRSGSVRTGRGQG